MPDAIKGDMDSIRSEVLDFYKVLVRLYFSVCVGFSSLSVYVCNVSKLEGTSSTFLSIHCCHLLYSEHAIFQSCTLVCCLQGTKIIDESHDQDTNDLHKSVAYIWDCTSDTDKSSVS